MTPRPYQDSGVVTAIELLTKHGSTLGVAATGLGKTVMFCHIAKYVIEQLGKRVLILAHTGELVRQAARAAHRILGVPVEIEMADEHADSHIYRRAPVVVGTVQTQVAGRRGEGRMTKFDPKDFGLVIIDEAHRSVAATYKRIIDYWRSINPDIWIYGTSATPDRFDGRGLAEVFDSVAFNYDILFGINEGWLVGIDQHTIMVEDLDFSNVAVVKGDLSQTQVAEIMEEERILHEVAGPTIDAAYGLPTGTTLQAAETHRQTSEPVDRVLEPMLAGRPRRKTLMFCSSVHHAELMAHILNRYIPHSARWLSGKTPKPERDAMLADFTERRFQFLCNVDVLVEGYDDPGIELIAIARPTKSRAKYAQMIGRGTRTLPGVIDGLETADERKAAIAASAKPSVEVLDFHGNAGRHKLVTAADILGVAVPAEVLARAKKQAEKARVSVLAAIGQAQADEIAERKAKHDAMLNARQNVIASVQYQKRGVDPFDLFDLNGGQRRTAERGPRATPGQASLLEKFGIDGRGLSRNEASKLIDENIRRERSNGASFEQIKILARHGIDAKAMSRDQARGEIDRVFTRTGVKKAVMS